MDNRIHAHICKWMSGEISDNTMLRDICNCVTAEMGISLDTLKSKVRKREHVISRGFIFILSLHHTSFTHKTLSDFFNMDRTSVIHCIQSLNQMLDNDLYNVNEHFKNILNKFHT